VVKEPKAARRGLRRRPAAEAQAGVPKAAARKPRAASAAQPRRSGRPRKVAVETADTPPGAMLSEADADSFSLSEVDLR
jgi:hypothetical protein